MDWPCTWEGGPLPWVWEVKRRVRWEGHCRQRMSLDVWLECGKVWGGVRVGQPRVWGSSEQLS
jgi:hypothetical protein